MLLITPLSQAGLVLGATETPLFDQVAVLGFIKILFLIVGLLYLIFSFIVLRQVQLMRRTLITDFGPFVQLLGLVQVGLAIALFLFFLVI